MIAALHAVAGEAEHVADAERRRAEHVALDHHARPNLPHAPAPQETGRRGVLGHARDQPFGETEDGTRLLIIRAHEVGAGLVSTGLREAKHRSYLLLVLKGELIEVPSAEEMQ